MSGLRITNATIGTVTLHDPSTGVMGQLRYQPTPSEPTADTADTALDDGGETPIVQIPNISETAEVYIDSGSDSALRTVIRTLNMLFEQARTYQRTRAGGAVYLEWRGNDTEAWYRSEILYGHAVGQEGLLDSWMLPAGRAKLTLSIHRRFYWEGAESYLTLTNQHGTSSAGLTVYNTNDANGDNYVEVTTALAGDLPAPCRVEYTNTFASATNMQHLYLGHSAIATPSPSDLILETSAMTGVVGSPSTISGTYSNGSTRSWTLGSGTQNSLGYWTLPSSLLAAGLGLWYRVIARVSLGSTLYQMRFTIRDSSNVVALWTGKWTAASPIAGFIDLGATQLPPYLRGVTSGMQSLVLNIEVRGTTASGYSLDFDCIYLLPTESWRVVRSAGFGLAQNRRIWDDAISETTYADDGSGGSIFGNYVPDGPPIMLRPGRTNRIYMLANNTANASEITRTGSVRIAYRPRYRMV